MGSERIRFFPHGFAKNRKILFSLLIYSWNSLRDIGGPIYLSLIFSIIFLFLIQPKSFLLNIFLLPAVSLLVTSLSLSGFTIYEQFFICYLHFDLISSIRANSPFSLICAIAETTFFFIFGELNKYQILMIGFSFISIIAIQFFLPKIDFSHPFNFTIIFFTGLLQLTKNQKINLIIFGISIILSVPRFSISLFRDYTLSKDNVISVIYSTICIIVNVFMIKSGFKYKIISVISDGVMSTFNSISMYFLVIADIITHKSPTKQFSYGFKRATVICTLGLSILLILVSINLIGTAIESLISEENDESENVPSDIINLALISLLVNTFGLVFVGGSEKNDKKVEKCELSGGLITIISDLISAGSIVLNNYLIVYHNIKFLDPYLSLFSSLLILVMTLKEMKEVVSILNLKTSNDISLDFLINESDENLDNSLNIWKLDEETDVVSLKLKITDKNDYGKTLDMISNSLTEKNIEYYTIEIENI